MLIDTTIATNTTINSTTTAPTVNINVDIIATTVDYSLRKDRLIRSGRSWPTA